ncbi:MAG: hypothetical protein KJ559_02650, partial [Nanoarchaeota archaeon]|nr:hypothetical protein [Nanoarchaeota archaeon]
MEKKENRVKKISMAYYSIPEIQKAIYDFCKNRETIARSGESFGKRPDTIEYPSEVLQQAKNGFTSFHCSEELWESPLELSKGLSKEELDEIRIGWDLLIDVDCKWFDYSKKACEAILETLEKYGVKNFGVKFSGSKGWHILVPWKAFPETINNIKTKNMFPELPRIIVEFIKFESEKIMSESLPDDFFSQFKNINIKKGFKCRNCNEIAQSYELATFICPRCKREETKKLSEKDNKKIKCSDCGKYFDIKDLKEMHECKKCNISSLQNPENFSSSVEIDLFELMGLDIVLVSSRHLFRAPYSLHEKGLSSIVLDKKDISEFNPKDADPLKAKVKNFYPDAVKEEARELVISALDWHKEKNKEKHEGKNREKTNKDYKEIKIDKKNIVYPPCIENILKGLKDGKKRALFVLINYFKSLGLENEEIKEIIYEWNKKNKPSLNERYIEVQMDWSNRNKKILPPNCEREHYKGIDVC